MIGAGLALATLVSLYPMPSCDVDPAAPPPAVVVQAGDQLSGRWVRALDGEGLIALTTRVCGNADRWEAVAFGNFIDGPDYRVYVGQRLWIRCSPTPVA